MLQAYSLVSRCSSNPITIPLCGLPFYTPIHILTTPPSIVYMPPFLPSFRHQYDVTGTRTSISSLASPSPSHSYDFVLPTYLCYPLSSFISSLLLLSSYYTLPIRFA
ncbi:hypothetical protein R3P38DRAFT_1448449 [Favolaschia claudopus]|uniref:Uncharacterized protein n=1 Tax=Favolaschia claudopus TaxID=2862362 RepID=A0AAW0AMS6_9AGAR